MKNLNIQININQATEEHYLIVCTNDYETTFVGLYHEKEVALKELQMYKDFCTEPLDKYYIIEIKEDNENCTQTFKRIIK